MDMKSGGGSEPDVVPVAADAGLSDVDVKADVPGQQLGLYNDSGAEDVRQMVSLLNNAGEENQSGRG